MTLDKAAQVQSGPPTPDGAPVYRTIVADPLVLGSFYAGRRNLSDQIAEMADSRG